MPALTTNALSRRTVLVGGLTAVVGGVLSASPAAAAVGRSGLLDAPTAASGSLPTATGTRVPWLHPFAVQSYDNISIGSGAVYEAATSGPTAKLLTGSPMINRDAWSFQVALAKSTDPLIKVSYISSSGTVKATHSVRIPTALEPTAGTDRHVAVVQPDGVKTYEMYKFKRTSSSTATSTYVNINDLRTSALTRGSRASGISFLHGLIRSHEIAGGSIPHALAMSAPASMLKATPTSADGTVAYNSAGKAVAVWPARLQDTQTATMTYAGNIAMGAMFAIPASVSLSTLGLSAEGLALGKALQDYGVHVLVQSTKVCLYAEPSSSAAATDRMKVDWQQKLFPRMRRITNNIAGSLNSARDPLDYSRVAGGGTRRRAAATSLSIA